MILLSVFGISNQTLLAQQQNVNKSWQVTTGTPSELFDFSNSTFDANNNVYLTGNEVLPNNTIAVLLEKFSTDGTPIWSEHWVCPSCSFATGVDIVVEGNDLYLTGLVQDGPSSPGMDIFVQHYNAITGQLLWSQILDNNNSAAEFPVDIQVNAGGTIFVTGATQQSASEYDVFTASLSSTGSIQWQVVYDYAGFDETPTELKLLANNGVEVLVGSAVSATDWEIALLTYDQGGLLIDTLRSDSTGLDRDLPLTYHRDGNDIYLGGSQTDATTNEQDAYLKKYTIDSSIAIDWSKSVDIDGRSETLLGIDLNDDGDVFVTGGAADAQGNNWAWLQRFAPQDGATVWQRVRAVSPAEDIVSGRFFQLNELGHPLVAFNYTNSLGQSVHVAQYDDTGRRRWEIPLVSEAAEAKATNLMVAHQKAVFIVGRLESTNGQQFYHIDKLEDYEKVNTPVLDSDGIPYMVQEDLIVRFNSCLLDTTFINDPYRLFGRVDEIVQDSALIADMDAALGGGGKLGTWRLFKIYRVFNTQTTSFTGRHGRTVYVPPLWATLVLEMQGVNPDPHAAQAALDTISSSKIVFSHPNLISRLPTPPPAPSPVLPPPPPNDELFGEQLSLTDPGVGINVEPAWDILDEEGGFRWQSSEFPDGLDIVLIDSGVRFDHEDLRCATCPGLQPNQEGDPSIVMAALDFSEGNMIPTDLQNAGFEGTAQDAVIDGDPAVSGPGHGTRSAGILSAMRNNTDGIAGITGNDLNSVRLHSYRYVPPGSSSTGSDGSDNGLSVNIIAALEHMITQETPTLDLTCLEAQLKSDGSGGALDEENIVALREVIELVYDAGYIQSTAKGNFGGIAPVQALRSVYPGSYEDRWSLSVGASGTDGTVVIQDQNDGIDSYGSNYGNGIDLIAPGVQFRADGVTSITTSISKIAVDDYTTFSGTSAALPHVTGTAAMLMLHHPTQLAQEDVEHLLEYTATDIIDGSLGYPLGYEQENGWGRLNAGAAVNFIHPAGEDYQVVQVEVTGDLTIDENPFGCPALGCEVFLTHPEGDLGPGLTAQNGRIVKYSHNFSIDLEQYQIAPPQLPINSDPAKVPFWTRSSGTNLWHTPTAVTGNIYEFDPTNHLFFEGTPTFTGNILSGTIAGYAVIPYLIEGEGPITSLKCPTGTPMVVSVNNELSINACYSGTPRLSFSFLGQNPVTPVPPIIIDVVTEVREVAASPTSLRVAPNPVTDFCRVELSAHEKQEGVLFLLDALGHRLLQVDVDLPGRVPTDVELDMSRHPAGIYYVQYLTDHGVITEKIIKQ